MNRQNRRTTFESIYATHKWSGTSLSGPGSDAHNTTSYIEFTNKTLRQIGNGWPLRVLDIGCGDFSTSRCLDFQYISSYLGLDIVASVIRQNITKWSSEKVRFDCLDCVTADIPSADVIIVKDVLQHLSNESVTAVLKKLAVAGRFGVLTNDFKKLAQRKVGFVPLGWVVLKGRGALNEDIEDGGTRPLDLTLPPFGLSASREHTFPTITNYGPPIIKYVKKTLVIRF